MAATRLRVATSFSKASVSDASDAELVRAGAAGDREVFAELFRRHGGAARRVARAVAANDHDAADAAAEAFTRVFDAIVSGRAPQMEFRAYLLAATRNAAIDQRRRAERPAAGDDLGSGRRDSGELAGGDRVGDGDQPAGDDREAGVPGPSERLAADESSQLVAQAFQGLPPRWQSILWLTEVEGFPAREAAGVLGLSPNNVSQLAVRARARLRARYLQAHVRNHAQPRCQRTVDQLGAYLAGTLAAGQRARVEDHLRGCAACRERSAEVEDLGMALRRALVPAPILVGALTWLRRGSGGRDRLVAQHSQAPTTPPAAVARAAAAVKGSGATAAVTADVPDTPTITDVPVTAPTAQATGGGVLTAVSSSPTLQALASLPVSAVAPLVAVGPAVRMALRSAAAVVALIPVLGGIVGTDPGITAAVAPPPPAATVPTTTPAAPPPVPAATPVTEVAAPVPPPLPATSHTLTTVATVLGSTIDVFEPGADAAAFYLDNPQPSGAALVFLVLDQQGDWLHVLLPLRPNGRTGWIRSRDVSLSNHPFSMVIELAAHRITAFNAGEPFLSEPVAVGTSHTPTPGGLYYTKELIQPVDAAGRPDTDGPYGPWAFGLSGFSEVLFEFMGGDGALGIHGNNDPSVLGTDVSHGCIRMSNEGITMLADTLPMGVPVEILP